MRSLFVKTRVLAPRATFDGLLPRGITIQSINESLMTGRSCLRDTLSRGISAYLAIRVWCIFSPTLYSVTLKCLNPYRHTQNRDISIRRFNQGSLYSYPWEFLSIDLGYPTRSCQCWPDITMKINHRYRANRYKS